ncbi:MAG: hypothetical protein HYZ81_23335 [Nitrospinae bacterium]|nr:hypothetical protein [Nitrospinota bacterium]
MIVKLALKGEAHRITARRLVRDSIAAGRHLIAPPIFISEGDTVIRRRVYDASYAALAELRGCEFWTADKVCYDAVQATLSFVKYLPDYP